MIEKLRVWDGKKFHYVPDFNLHFSTHGIIAALNNGGMVFVESNELQQWIGKTDGGGTDIYEGDMIQHESSFSTHVGVIEFGIDYHLSGYRVVWEGETCTVRMGKCKVIGNVHEGRKAHE